MYSTVCCLHWVFYIVLFTLCFQRRGLHPVLSTMCHSLCLCSSRDSYVVVSLVRMLRCLGYGALLSQSGFLTVFVVL
eukprot:9086946-Pyramimonas_sp.AAC.1